VSSLLVGEVAPIRDSFVDITSIYNERTPVMKLELALLARDTVDNN